ncbi:hypothetical protein [Pseudonocardia sp.]|jgi:hypothetical protein|uniref:hypothetical protein n=1 Tax=Pseudonocardia sp. TaxID=60912 RepID=UPI0031FC7BDC
MKLLLCSAVLVGTVLVGAPPATAAPPEQLLNSPPPHGCTYGRSHLVDEGEYIFATTRGGCDEWQMRVYIEIREIRNEKGRVVASAECTSQPKDTCLAITPIIRKRSGFEYSVPPPRHEVLGRY